MKFNRPNFKRPCWMALFVSFGALLLGSYACWGLTYLMAERGADASAWLRSVGGPAKWGFFWLAAFGALGSVASVIWWLLGAIGSIARSYRA